MIICNLSDKKFNYEFEKLARLFFPFEQIRVVNELSASDRLAVCEEKGGGSDLTLSVALRFAGCDPQNSVTAAANAAPEEKERLFSVMLYKCLSAICGVKPPWGILTGVRPARLYLSLTERMGQTAAEEYFHTKLLVSKEKLSLCRAVARREAGIIAAAEPFDYSLYVSVPFCPTRCSYCSFVSHSIESAAKLIPVYTDMLCRELEITAAAANKAGLTLKTVYMGGGTPTALSAEQLDTVFNCIHRNFDFSQVAEFTVEAGRPDTVTAEKLAAIKAAGATRISINPQTMRDSVLERIGRKHTAEQTRQAFVLARSMGFDNINCDLIAGLPGDDLAGFDYTMDRVLRLDPESITVHALSMKRASYINLSGGYPERDAALFAEYAVNAARARLTDNGYAPYYTYRQSKTVGNLENTGYSKPGYEGLYNVYIMDETHTVLAAGASAVTKLRAPHGNDIKRIFNYKYPYEYINGFDRQITRKEEITQFYEKNA